MRFVCLDSLTILLIYVVDYLLIVNLYLLFTSCHDNSANQNSPNDVLYFDLTNKGKEEEEEVEEEEEQEEQQH